MDAVVPPKPPHSPKPVVIIHGLNEDAANLRFLEDHIRLRHPGTEVYRLNLYYGLLSLLPLWYQLRHFREGMAEVVARYPNGVHLIGYSQGGIIARGLLETMSDHRVHTYISLAAPQNGVYGETELQNRFYYKIAMVLLNLIAYTPLGRLCSVFNLWHDPKREDKYIKGNHFLPVLNNLVDHPQREEFKRNFLKVHRMILIGSSKDTTLTPWETSEFGYYDERFEVQDLTQQRFYLEDTFGLQTLDHRGDLIRLAVADVNHEDWPHNVNAIDTYILPWLT